MHSLQEASKEQLPQQEATHLLSSKSQHQNMALLRLINDLMASEWAMRFSTSTTASYKVALHLYNKVRVSPRKALRQSHTWL